MKSCLALLLLTLAPFGAAVAAGGTGAIGAAPPAGAACVPGAGEAAVYADKPFQGACRLLKPNSPLRWSSWPS